MSPDVHINTFTAKHLKKKKAKSSYEHFISLTY